MRMRACFVLVMGLAPAAWLACGGDDTSSAQFRPRDDAGGGVAAEGGPSETTTDASGPPFVKVLDLDATLGITGAEVLTWLDSSGNSNTGAAVAGALPVEAAINGKRAVRFDGTRHIEVADSPSLQMGTGDFVLAVVATYETANTATSHILAAKQAPNAPLLGPALLANYAFRPGNLTDRSTTVAGLLRDGAKGEAMAVQAVPQPEAGKPHLFLLYRKGDFYTLRVDRADRGTGAKTEVIVDTSAPGAPLRIGGDGVAGHGIVGHIGEVVLVKGAMPERERERLESDLVNKWLRPPPPPPADAGRDASDSGI